MSNSKSTVVIDYRPKRNLSLQSIYQDIYGFMVNFPEMNVEGVTVHIAGFTTGQIQEMMKFKGLGKIKLRPVFEHSQITYIRVDHEN